MKEADSNKQEKIKSAQITPTEIKKSLEGISELYLSQRDKTSQMAQLEAEEYADKNKMRRRWSNFLMVCVFVIILCQISLFILVGRKWLIFDDPWLARILFPGTFIQILGFVVIVINYLFPDRS